MTRPLSDDLRRRVVTAVDDGMPRRGAAKRFGIAPSTAIKWVRVETSRLRYDNGRSGRPRAAARKIQRGRRVVGFATAGLDPRLRIRQGSRGSGSN